MPDPVYVLSPAPVRRWILIVSLLVLAAIVGAVLIRTPPAHPGWTVFLIGVLCSALWLAREVHRATSQTLELHPDGLFAEDGTCLCRMSEIERIERGVFAFKPAGGFLLRLKEKRPAAWWPGLWWRRGRVVGVGGVTARSAGRAMAEVIAERVEKRA